MLRYLLITLFTIYSTPGIAQKDLVRVHNGQLTVNNRPYHFIGTNYWYGGLLGLDGENGKHRLRKELDFLKRNGVTNLRLVAGAEGSGPVNGIERIGPAFQVSQGKFDMKVLEGLDLLLDEMSKRNMKAVIFLSNNWEWSGGFLQYLNWNNLLPDSVMRRSLNWDENRDYISKFYSCEPCKAAYRRQAEIIIDRTNRINGKKYKNDVTIMAWELANEPRPMRPAANDAYLDWIGQTASFIKSIDKTHLVTTGHEGEIGTQSIELYARAHEFKNIDYLTIHIWPKNWAWFSDTSISKGFDNVIQKTKEYIEKHIIVSKQLNKPLVIEEFGLPRDGHSFERNTSTYYRDKYYKFILEYFGPRKKTNKEIAGVNFWAFGGFANKINPDHRWKPGDPFTGDPPMEEQGLNSVFPSDSTTWKLIRKYGNQRSGIKVD